MNSSWRKQYLEEPPNPMSKMDSGILRDEILKDYLIHFTAVLEDGDVILDIDCFGCGFWKFLRENHIKIIGISETECKAKIADNGIKILHMPFIDISFIGIFSGFLFLFVPNFLPPDMNLEILNKAYLALRLGGIGLIALEVERNDAVSAAAKAELSRKYLALEGDRLINGKYRFVPTIESVKNLIHLSEFQLTKHTVKDGKAFFLVRK